MMFTKVNRVVNATTVTMKKAGRARCCSTMTLQRSHSSACMQLYNAKNATFQPYTVIPNRAAITAMQKMIAITPDWVLTAKPATTPIHGKHGYSIMIKPPISPSTVHMKKLVVTTVTRQHQKENYKHQKTVYPATAARIYTIVNLAGVAAIAIIQKVLKR